MAQIMGGVTSTGLTIGAGAGLVIALISGAAVYLLFLFEYQLKQTDRNQLLWVSTGSE